MKTNQHNKQKYVTSNNIKAINFFELIDSTLLQFHHKNILKKHKAITKSSFTVNQ